MKIQSYAINISRIDLMSRLIITITKNLIICQIDISIAIITLLKVNKRGKYFVTIFGTINY